MERLAATAPGTRNREESTEGLITEQTSTTGTGEGTGGAWGWEGKREGWGFGWQAGPFSTLERGVFLFSFNDKSIYVCVVI